MKKTIIALASIFLAFSFTSCNNESVQSYIVKSQEKKGFITFDVPASIIQLKSDDASEDTKKALASLKKVNLVALPFQDNAEAIQTEKANIEAILKKSQYKNLMKSNIEGNTISLYYMGSEDAIDEVIAFGYSEKMGVGLARVLGDNMNPALIMKMMDEIKFDAKNMDLSKLNVLFSGKKKKKEIEKEIEVEE